MVPALVVPMDALPLTPNGKVDRRALPRPDGAVPEAGYVAPGNAVEEVLAILLADLLEVERVSVAESFFDLGGHSLLATRFLSLIRETLQADVPLRALFEAPSVAALAASIVAREAEPGVTARVADVVLSLLAMSDEEMAEAGDSTGD
jgi:acyl carrier protein